MVSSFNLVCITPHQPTHILTRCRVLRHPRKLQLHLPAIFSTPTHDHLLFVLMIIDEYDPFHYDTDVVRPHDLSYDRCFVLEAIYLPWVILWAVFLRH